MKKILKTLSVILLLSLIISVIPLSAGAENSVSNWLKYTPVEMQDNAALRALKYTGYDVKYLKDNGLLYDYRYTSYGIKDQTNKDEVLSGIGYDNAWGFVTGTETVADGATVSGNAPDLNLFRSEGMVCSNFVSYYLFNYLPNIEGIDTKPIKNYMDPLGNGSQFYHSEKWAEALQNAAAQSEISGVTMYTNAEEGWANLVPGDIVIFTQQDDSSIYKHIAIYAGTKDMYKGGTSRGEYHYIIHVANERGPEISTAEYQALNNNPAKNGIPTEFYHLGGITAPLPDPEPDPDPEPELGGFIVHKESNSQYTSQFFKFNLWRVEKDESRTHIGEYSICAGDPGGFGSNKKVFADLPVGQYVIQESQTPVDGWTLDSTYHYVTAVPYDPDTYYEGYPTVTLTNTLANDGGMSIKVTKQTTTGTGADRGWKVNLYFMGANDYEWRLIDTKITAQDAADPSCTFLLSEEELWTLCADNYEITGQFMVMEDQTAVDGWIIDSSQYIFDAKLGGSYTATFTNSACGSMTVTKVNAGGEPISGSTMLLEWSSDGTNWAPVQYSAGEAVLGCCSSEGLADGCLTTGASGIITFTGLHPAVQYRLTELTTADGYTLLAEPAYMGALDEDLQVELTVVNGRSFILPATGESNTFALVTLGAVLLVTAGSFFIVITGKPDENNLPERKKK